MRGLINVYGDSERIQRQSSHFFPRILQYFKVLITLILFKIGGLVAVGCFDDEYQATALASMRAHHSFLPRFKIFFKKCPIGRSRMYFQMKFVVIGR